MSRSIRWHKRGVVTFLAILMLPAAICRASPAMTGKFWAQFAASSTPQNGLPDGYDPRRDPEKDLDAARGEAKKAGKNIFVEVGGEWCTWCHILDRFFHEHPNLEALRNKNYVPMKVSIEPGESQPRVFLSLPLHSWVSAYLHFGRRGEIDSLTTNQRARGRPKLQRKAVSEIAGAVRPEAAARSARCPVKPSKKIRNVT